jgi:uncharacterized protein YkwD
MLTHDGAAVPYFPSIPDLLFCERVVSQSSGGEFMKNLGSWCGALVAALAIGAAFISYIGFPSDGLIALSADQSSSSKEQSNSKDQSNSPKAQSNSPKEQSNSKDQVNLPKEQPNSKDQSNSPKEQPSSKEQSNPPKSAPAPAAAQDPNCPGKDSHALMCRLVNEYRVKHGLKPVQLDAAVTHEAQYWSDQLNRQSACWFLYHDTNYHDRMRARFPGRRFRENAACSGSTGEGAKFILQKWIDSSGHRENMLTPTWKTIGVGVTKNIWVIDFTN